VHEDAALRFLGALNAFDRVTVESMLAPDARWISPRATIEGRDALMQALAERGQPGSKLDELTVSLADRTMEENGDTVTTTVRREYHWKESGDFSHGMVARTALTFRDGKIAVVEEFVPKRAEGR
jgi:ketosteroid isomerase-like protein